MDRTPREIINVENGVIEDPRATPKADSVTNAIPSPATSSAFVRRQAARDAESRLSHYTYQESDVGGSGIQSPDAESRIAKHGVVEGWPDIARVSAEKPQAEAPRHPSRGSFMAKRGGGKKSHTRTKSGDVESTKRSRTATLEDSDGSSDGEPVARRRKVHTSPTPEAEETPASILDPKPVPNVCDFPTLPYMTTADLGVLESCIKQNTTSREAQHSDEEPSFDDSPSYFKLERKCQSKLKC